MNWYILFQPDWPKKLFLAHGVVCGMEYLHSIEPHPVIHGDLKIQNVLVGDNLVAKVCVIVYTVSMCISLCVYQHFDVVGSMTGRAFASSNSSQKFLIRDCLNKNQK